MPTQEKKESKKQKAVSSGLETNRSPGSHEKLRASLEGQIAALMEKVALLDKQELAQQQLAEQQKHAQQQKLAELQRLEALNSTHEIHGHNAEGHEAQNAELAELREQNALQAKQIAALQQGAASPKKDESNLPLAISHSPSHSASATSVSVRATTLPTPTLQSLNALSSTVLRVAWNAVANANGYVIKTATNNLLTTDVRTFDAEATATHLLMGGFAPNTRYFVQVMAKGDGVEFNDSNWSTYKNTETWVSEEAGSGTNENVTQLQGWLSDLKNVNDLMFANWPELETGTLTTLQRRRLLGSGVRRYGYFDKISDVAVDYPQFWPLGSDESEKLKEIIREVEVLRNLLVFFEGGARIVTDRLLELGDAAFRIANVYYVAVREAARRRLNPDAEAVLRLIRKFWRRSRSKNATTSKKQVLRDVKGIINGTKVGKISFEKEADRVIKGKKSITNETQPAPRGGFEEVEYVEDAE